MATRLSESPNEGSTFVVTCTFTDEDGASIDAGSITAITWTLTDSGGTVINSREDVVAAVANPLTIVLSGNDLAASSDWLRTLTVKGTYNGDNGTGLPIREEASFSITPLVNEP